MTFELDLSRLKALGRRLPQISPLRSGQFRLLGFVLIFVSAAGVPAGHAQSPLADSSSRAIAHGAAVEYLFPEQVTVHAGTASSVSLHFRVAPGFHINSHTPKDDYLIPTSFSMPASSGVRLASTSYPAGENYTLPLDPGTKLDVYTDEFAIQTSLIAARGNHLVQASLRYQACDKGACYPPKTITVPIDVIGK